MFDGSEQAEMMTHYLCAVKVMSPLSVLTVAYFVAPTEQHVLPAGCSADNVIFSSFSSLSIRTMSTPAGTGASSTNARRDHDKIQ